MILNPPFDIQPAIRISYGILQVFFLYTLAANRQLFFRTEKWNGYIFSSPLEDFWNRPVMADLLLALWGLSVFSFTIGFQTVLFSLINLVLCRYYFIHLRWKSLSRGCGAPGFISQWLSVAVFLLEFTSALGPSPIRVAVLLLLQLDFAFIILSAGFYKFFGGYRRNEGMEYGMVNPMWGYWWKIFFKTSPSAASFKLLNQLSWTTEILAGILMLIPATRFFGGALLAVTFLFIAMQVRLGALCYMVVVVSMIYMGSFGWPLRVPGSIIAEYFPLKAQIIFLIILCAQIGLLPLAYAGIWYNHRGKKRLLGPFQRLLELYTNWFGIIIWRVFSKDLTELVVTVTAVSEAKGSRFVSDYAKRPEWTGYRYSQVTESIAVICLFTTVRYYPDQKDFFIRKLKMYAKSVVEPGESRVIYKVSRVLKKENQFAEKLCAVYTVNLNEGKFDETIYEDIRYSTDKENFLLTPARKPGSYAKND